MTIVKTMKRVIAYLLFLILLIWICGYGAFLLYIQTLTPQQPEYKTDAIVVLTGGKLRTKTGLELYVNNMAPQLFISGVHNLVKKSEIKAMWDGTKPLPKCCITLGRSATTTVGNAEEVYQWIKANKIMTIRLVTSNYHMPRAMLELNAALEKLNTTVIVHPTMIIPHPVHEKGSSKYYALAFNEYNKTIFRWSVLALRKQGLPI
jgi:uncharacterized SAM-binding protein YcdF (DUF218 family)